MNWYPRAINDNVQNTLSVQQRIYFQPRNGPEGTAIRKTSSNYREREKKKSQISFGLVIIQVSVSAFYTTTTPSGSGTSGGGGSLQAPTERNTASTAPDLFSAFSISITTSVDSAIVGGLLWANMSQSTPRNRSSCTRHCDWWVCMKSNTDRPSPSSVQHQQQSMRLEFLTILGRHHDPVVRRGLGSFTVRQPRFRRDRFGVAFCVLCLSVFTGM